MTMDDERGVLDQPAMHLLATLARLTPVRSSRPASGSGSDLGKTADARLTFTPPLSVALIDWRKEQRSLNVGNSLARSHAWEGDVRPHRVHSAPTRPQSRDDRHFAPSSSSCRYRAIPRICLPVGDPETDRQRQERPGHSDVSRHRVAFSEAAGLVPG